MYNYKQQNPPSFHLASRDDSSSSRKSENIIELLYNYKQQNPPSFHLASRDDCSSSRKIDRVKNFNQFINENTSINEAFRFSKQKKELELLKQKVKEAQKELMKNNFAETASIQWTADVPQDELQKSINVRLNLCKMLFPTLVELLPNYFDNQSVSQIIYKFNNEDLQAYVPSKLYEFVSDSCVLNNDKAVRKLMLKLDELVDREK